MTASDALVGGVRIAYYVRGAGPPVLLIMGLGGRATDWNDRFLARLSDRFELITFDNRGTGRSQRPEGEYTLERMADEAVGVLDALGHRRAHVIGISMGGMIAQLLAIRNPEWVLTLTTMMADTGGATRVMAEPEVFAELLAAPLDGDVADAVEQAVRLRKLLSGPRFDEPAARERAQRLIGRAYYPVGVLRQAAAVLSAGDRTFGLARLRIPALVVHGTSDPLVPFENGLRVHRAIPGSRLLVLDGVGHDLPPAEAQRVLDAMVTLARS